MKRSFETRGKPVAVKKQNMRVTAINNESFRERLATKEGQNLTATRGSLSKCVLRCRDFTEKIFHLVQNETNCEMAFDAVSLERLKDELTSDLKLHDLEMRKSTLSASAAEVELKYYATIAECTKSSISECKLEIKKLKRKLSHELGVRGSREEYESLAKEANSHAPRVITEAKINELNISINKLRKRNSENDAELELREKQFQLLMQSIFDLKSERIHCV